MRQRWRWPRLTAGVLAALVLGGCTAVVSGRYDAPAPAPNANLTVVGDSGDAFDQTVKNGLADVMSFWRKEYPSVSGGRPLPGLTGKLYSVDGANPNAAAKQNACLSRAGVDVIVDNAFYCELDDSIAWDRNPHHLVPVLGAKYGSLLVAMVFAHEFGHAVQARLGLFNQQVPTIVHESQADCAAGAFTATVMQNQAPHIRATAADLDRALIGYLNVRDDTPADEKDISHGDGFDRIGALADGFEHGVTECYKPNWADRKFTERPFVPGSQDEQQQGNEPFEQVINPGPANQGGGGLQPDLNLFWKTAATSINKTWHDVKIAQATHPACGDTTSSFGYCPDDNTVYFDENFARQAYDSMSVLSVDNQTGNVSVIENPLRVRLGACGTPSALQPVTRRRRGVAGRRLLHRGLRQGHQCPIGHLPPRRSAVHPVAAGHGRGDVGGAAPGRERSGVRRTRHDRTGPGTELHQGL
jgi:predicted metalloprotease